MTAIAEAFVAIRPDLSMIATDLRAQLPKELAKVGRQYRTIPIQAALEAGTIAKIRSELVRQISTMPPVVVPVTVDVTTTGTRAAVTREARSQIAASSAGVQRGASRAAQGATTAQTNAETKAIEKQAAAAKALADTQLQVANTKKAVATASKAVVAEDLTEAQALVTLKQAQADVAAVEALQGTVTDKQLAKLQAQSAATLELAAAQRRLVTAARPQSLASQIGETDRARTLRAVEQAEKQLQNIEAAEPAILARGTAALQRFTLARKEQAATALKAATDLAVAQHAGEVQSPFQTRLGRIQESIDLATPALGTQRAVTAANSAVARTIRLQEQIAASTIPAVRALNEQAEAALADARAFQVLAQSQRTQTVAAKEQASAFAGARRGVLATAASFGGLRGAVLSATGPFLIATVAVTAFAKIVQQAADLQRSLNIFQSVSGATAEQLAAVSAEAESLGADLTLPATSATDAATAMTELAKAGLSVKDSMDAARGVLELSAAADLGVADAAKITATQLNAFGLAGTEAIHVTDLLAGAANAAQGEISDFAIGFQQVDAVAKQAGLSIDQTTSLLTQLARAGIRGSDAGTSFRVELQRLVPSTKPAIKGFKELGVELDKTATIGQQFDSIVDQFTKGLAKLNTQEQSRVIKDIFGQDASRAAIITLTKGSKARRDIEETVTQAGLGQEQAAARAKGLTGSIDGLKSSTQTLATTLGQQLLPALEAITHNLSAFANAANSAVKTIAPLFAVIRGASNLVPGGGDEIAKIGLIIGATRLLSSEIQKRFVKTAVVAGESAAAQVTAQNTVTTSLERTLLAQGAVNLGYAKNAAAATASAATQSRAQALLGRLGGRGGVAALGIGLGASIAGEQIGGTGGSILGGAGTGAIAGSAFGLQGAIAGALAGSAIAALNAASKSQDAADDKIRAKWDSMTFLQQRAAIAAGVVPGTGPLATRVGGRRPVNEVLLQIATLHLKEKPNPFQGQFNFGPATPTSAAATGVASPFTNLLKNIGKNQKKQEEEILKALGQGPSIPLGPNARLAIQLAKARASGKDDAIVLALRAQAKFDRERIAALQLELDNGIDDPKRLKKVAADLQSRLGDLTSTENEITQILDKSKEDAKKLTDTRLQAQEATLRSAADAADNQGTAETALINFLKKQVSRAKANTLELAQAQDALTAEEKKRKDAIENSIQLQFSLQEARVNTAASAAALTQTKADDIKAEKARIAVIDREIANAKALVKAAARGSDALTQAKTDLENLKAKRNDVLNTIKGLKEGANGGATVEDFFQTALQNFRSFGGGTSGIISAQGERGDLSGRFLDILKNNRGVGGGQTFLGPNGQPRARQTVAERNSALSLQIEERNARRDAVLLIETRRQTRLLRLLVEKSGPLGTALNEARKTTSTVSGGK